ncbi:LamG-like jellyroll fold domain-containing protein [Nostoc sp. LEGE 12450]|uniref:LamG-like jellyroll fold domain-containing protein n=1 Tax=Nostoc sp. LEGE 12450 TaxID=1828643 RepID=UPI001881FF62|nr:LamG-like jellyroll fold domain-containing protein [Nostoc sp. LEGE 12450]MBE8990083.1 hypothetical protein [Nostoc sp. LEGE 12450]
MSSTITEIISIVKDSIAKTGQFTLKDSTIDALPLGKLMNLLEIPQLDFNYIVSDSENTITIAGQSSLLGAGKMAIEATFGEIDGTVYFSVSAKDVGSCHIPGISSLVLEQGQFALHVTGKADDVTGTFSGSIHVGDTTISNAVFEVTKKDTDIVLHWMIAELDLPAISDVFLNHVSLPAELPTFHFKDIAIAISPQTGAFSFEIIAKDIWQFPANGGDLSISEVSLTIERDRRDSPTHCAITIQSNVEKEIVNGLKIKDFQLTFDLKGEDWSVDGKVNADVFDDSVTLEASYNQSQAGKTLKLAAEVDMHPVNLGEISLSLSGLELEFTKPAAEEGEIVPLEWSVAAAGRLSIPGAIESDGKLTIFREEKARGLQFEAIQAAVSIPLPSTQGMMELNFERLSIFGSSSDWTFAAAVDLAFHGLNATVQAHLPKDPIAMTFTANKQGVILSIASKSDIESIYFTVPPIEIESDRIELGTAKIGFSSLSIQLGRIVDLEAELNIGLPSQLNNLFGRKKDENGHIENNADGNPLPAVEFFRTLDLHDEADTTVQVKLVISRAGITLLPETSFIKAIESQTDTTGKSFWHCDFGEYGEINVDVPNFSYTGSSFAASGGFEVVKPLALPLTPIQHLLAACKLPGAAAMLPDRLPLDQEINAENFVDKLTERLEALLAKLGSGKLSNAAKEVLETISQSFHKLPTSFMDYLNFQMPQSFQFEVAASPAGALQFSASVKKDDPPIKLLFPSLMLGMPVLNGVTLRSISFGETAGGQLFLLEMDADIDQFDLATLVAAIALPENRDPLPSTQAIQRRLRLNNTVMVLPLEFPVPIPMFYDNIGIEYLGLEGLTLQAHAQFPKPTVDLQKISNLLSDIKEFFTNSDHPIPNQLPVEFKFSLNQNYLQLPKYLGGQALGTQGDGPTLDDKDIVHLLQGIRTLSVNELIQALPLKQRVGSTQVSFGPLSSSLGWLVTTPDEFSQIITQPTSKAIAYSALGLTTDLQATQILSVLPSTSTANEQGIVALLRGNFNVGSAKLDTVFGLAASSKGFKTGFEIKGAIAKVVTLNLAGAIAIASPKIAPPTSYALAFNGQSDCVKLNNPAALNFTGAITISAWIKPDAINGLRNIVAHGYTSSPTGEVYLRILNGQYQFGYWGLNSLPFEQLVAASIPAEDVGNWVYLTGVFDGGIWRLYRNGLLMNAVTGSQGAIQVSENWAIGARGTGTERFFQGKIADVQIWNRARSLEEIGAAMMRSPKGNEPGLIGYWQLNEGSGTVAHDATANANHGQLQGTQWQLITANNTAFRLDGSSSLSIPLLNSERPISKGQVQLIDDQNNHQFHYEGDLQLFSSNSLLKVNGNLKGDINDKTYRFSGDVTTSLAGLTLLGAKALIENDLIWLEGTWLGNQTKLTLQTADKAWQIKGTAGFNLPNLSVDLGVVNKVVGSNLIKVADNLSINVVANLSLDITLSNNGFSATVSPNCTLNGQKLPLSSFTITVAPSTLEALAEQIKQKIKEQASQIFDTLFPNAQAWLNGISSKAIAWTTNAYADMGKVLGSIYGQSASQAVSLLKGAKYDVDAVGHVLKEGFGKTSDEVTQILHDAQYSAIEVGQTLNRVFGKGANEVTSALKAVGYNATDVGQMLVSVFNATDNQVASLLKTAGYTASQVGQVLSDVFHESGQATAQILKNVGYTASEVGQALADVFQQGSQATAQILKNIGYTASDVGRVLSDVFRQGDQATAQILKNLGYSASEVGQVLKNVFGKSANDAASILSNVGYSIKDVARVLKDIYQQGKDSVWNFLKRMKLSLKDILSILKALFG